jgi:hypothetical protein
MGFATHLGPWLLGTVKNTTGTTAGTIRNTGCTNVSQNATIAFNTTAATRVAVLPAGSMITAIKILQTTTITSASSGTVTVLVNGTAAASATITTGTAGVLNLNGTAGQMATWSNVGSTDAILTFTPATLDAGAGTLVIEYTVRNSDGGQFQTTFNN